MFLRENKYLPERMKSSCKKLYQLNAQNATIKILFIAMVKIKMVIKSTFAVSAITNLLLIDQCLKKCPNILVVLFVVKQRFFITIMNITLITVVVIRNVTILCLFLNQTIYYLHLCLSLLERMILSVCVIPCI